MIEIKNYSKSFGERKIVDNLSMELPDSGIVCLLGPSGCGKTTLLNSLSGTDTSYEGNIYINSINITKLNENELSDFRLQNIGYVFQNFNLFNLLSVEDNLRISLYSSSNSSKHAKEKRIHDLLDILHISHLKKQRINKLSGGEKQRVAIARALVNNPKIILCDEPTGALDENNSKQVCDILKSFSSKTLIIVATHDLNVVRLIADYVIKFDDDGLTIDKKENNNQIKELPVITCQKRTNRSSLPLKLQVKQSIERIKSKKIRSLIVNGVLSLSLTGIGLSLILSNNISQKISDTFSEITNGNQIVMSLKNESINTIGQAYAASLDNVKSIMTKYDYFIKDYGANYLINFENFFKDRNDFFVDIKGSKYNLLGYSTRSINDFKRLDSTKNSIFPYKISNLENDQIILGMTYPDMVNFCYKLQIQRSYKSLGEYIRINRLYVSLLIENKSWQYDDEQIFEIKGIIETNSPCIFHSNSLFNEFVFEKMMRLPSIDINQQKLPWEMYKIYYIETNDECSKFLNEIQFDSSMNDFIFERINYSYNPGLCSPNKICEENRLYIYLTDKYGVNLGDLKYIQKLCPELSNYYVNSDFGYSSYASNILNGFSNNFYISSNENDLISAIDADSYIEDETLSVNIPDTVLMGNYMNSLDSGLKFSTLPNEIIAGRFPNNLNEICISLGVAESLKLENHGLGTYIYVSGLKSVEIINGKNEKEYGIAKLVVTGVTKEKKNYFYHSNDWTISFFRDCLGVSSFSLVPKSIVFEINNNVDPKNLIEKLNTTFPKYKFVSPIEEIDKSVSSTFEYANVMLLVFSIIASLISILLLGTIILLNILESKNETKLMKYLGIRNDDIQSVFIVQSILHGLIAFIIASIEIIIIDYFISVSLSDMFKTSVIYHLNFVPIIIVFLVSILLPFLISFVMSKSLIKRKK